MSKEAPWIALAIDWQDSAMLDESSHGERLAWICLLCFAKAQGRAGKVRLRGKKFAQNYRLSVEAVEAMMARAVAAGAVTVEDDIVTVVNWKLYQDPRVRSRGDENHRENGAGQPQRRHFTKTSENDATIPPRTTHPPPKKKAAAGAADPHFVEFWEAFPKLRRQDRADAWKAWSEAVKACEPEAIVAAVREYAASEVAQTKYVKGPGPWLRKQCWSDDREAWRDLDAKQPPRPAEHKRISREEFAQLIKDKQFLTGPYKDKPDSNGYCRAFGQLKNGRKVETSNDPNWTP